MLLRLRFLDRFRNLLDIVAIPHGARVPSISVESCSHIFCKAKGSGPRERDVVLVVEIDQPAEPQMA